MKAIELKLEDCAEFSLVSLWLQSDEKASLRLQRKTKARRVLIDPPLDRFRRLHIGRKRG